ncbi:membrane protein YIP1 [Angomonas deanei]|nr:membrane protein YIP1 [Angomonas deanei]|eukprot:EPY43323.1 membrane protein YIP1 [Angomonas deanei]
MNNNNIPNNNNTIPNNNNNNNAPSVGFFSKMMNNLLNDGNTVPLPSNNNNNNTINDIPLHQRRFGCPEDDLPLLEELGVFPREILTSAKYILFPFLLRKKQKEEEKGQVYNDGGFFDPNSNNNNNNSNSHSNHNNDNNDLVGPVIFAIVLAFILSLLKKEFHFNSIYIIFVTGVLFFKILLSLMHKNSMKDANKGSGVSITVIISALGYSLLPNVVLALSRLLFFIFVLPFLKEKKGNVAVPTEQTGEEGETITLHNNGPTSTTSPYAMILLLCSMLVVLWSSYCATVIIVKSLDMWSSKYLVFYPIFLFYCIFATFTIF